MGKEITINDLMLILSNYCKINFIQLEIKKLSKYLQAFLTTHIFILPIKILNLET